MVKKILTILTTLLCCVSCELTIRECDVFVVKGIETNEAIKEVYNYTYKYYLHWYQKYNGHDKCVIEVLYYYSDEKYEIGDTLPLINTNKIKIEKK